MVGQVGIHRGLLVGRSREVETETPRAGVPGLFGVQELGSSYSCYIGAGSCMCISKEILIGLLDPAKRPPAAVATT